MSDKEGRRFNRDAGANMGELSHLRGRALWATTQNRGLLVADGDNVQASGRDDLSTVSKSGLRGVATLGTGQGAGRAWCRRMKHDERSFPEIARVFRRILARGGASTVAVVLAGSGCGGALAPEDGAAADARGAGGVDGFEDDPPAVRGDGTSRESDSRRTADAGRSRDAGAVDARPGDAGLDGDEGVASFDPAVCGEGGARRESSPCESYVRQLPCDLADGGHPLDCARYCGARNTNCAVTVRPWADSGSHRLLACGICPGGRRPAGYIASIGDAPSAVAEYLATLAHLEAASIGAFRTLAAELDALGAPRALVRRARAAAIDEIRHARVVHRLATRHGARRIGRVRRRASPARRPLDAVALENVVEGCVRETFAALLAAWQAPRAGAFAATFAQIARDETRHASLAWDVAAWCHAQADEATRARLDAARAEAAAALREEIDVETPAELVSGLGLPTRTEALALFDALCADLWAPPAAHRPARHVEG